MSAEQLVERALAALRTCPTCSGTASEPANGDWSDPDAEMIECSRCDGTGDLLGALLARAYKAGRDDALEPLIEQAAAAAGDDARRESLPWTEG